MFSHCNLYCKLCNISEKLLQHTSGEWMNTYDFYFALLNVTYSNMDIARCTEQPCFLNLFAFFVIATVCSFPMENVNWCDDGGEMISFFLISNAFPFQTEPSSLTILVQYYCYLFFITNFGINFILYCISGQNFRFVWLYSAGGVFICKVHIFP